MVASALTANDAGLAELLLPEPLADGSEPEIRVIHCGLSWQRYLAVDKALGDDRPGPRFYYLDRDLEIMTTSNEHERLREWMGGFLEIYFEERGIEVIPRGQATMRDPLKEAGAEPDKSWCIGDEKQFPDLVLEIALTSGGVNKLEVYRRFNIPEVWFWRRNKIEIFTFGPTDYEKIPQSRLLPTLDVTLIERCRAIRSWRDARLAFRAGLSKLR